MSVVRQEGARLVAGGPGRPDDLQEGFFVPWPKTKNVAIFSIHGLHNVDINM